MKKLTVNKIYFMPAGFCKLNSKIFDTHATGKTFVTAPVWSYLLDTTDGPILIDTGMPNSCIDDPEGLFRGTEDEAQIVPIMHANDQITSLLAVAGYSRDDIACVISSHWHFDHAGGNSLFPKCDIIVQRKEYDAGMTQPNYFDCCRLPTLHYRCVDGDSELAPGIMLLATPGHTLGHQSVLIRDAKGKTLLLTIDAAYCRANFDQHIPFAVKDQREAALSIERLQNIASEEQAVVFFGHDPIQGLEWPKLPRAFQL